MSGNAAPKQPAPAPAQAQTAVSKVKKIEMYAAQLMKQAAEKDKAERFGDAIVDYLQAADLLLLLAKGEQGYSKWKAYSDTAIACQQRVRVLIAKQKLAEEKAESHPAQA